MARDREFTVIAILVIAAIVVSGLLGYYLSSLTVSPSGTTTKTTEAGNLVNLDIIPDYGGAGYDAFVLASTLASGSVPNPATNTTAPGANNNNITVSSGSTITFVITNIDTAINQNFSGKVPTPFTVYNDTDSGVVASQYKQGQDIAMQMSHTFTIENLGINVPIPIDTVVQFTLTFSKPGVYLYTCETPCGPGMGLNGYMQGYIVVK